MAHCVIIQIDNDQGRSNIMEERIIRIRVHPHLHKRFKMICVEKDLSMPKQTSELIRKFVEMMEQNSRMIK